MKAENQFNRLNVTANYFVCETVAVLVACCSSTFDSVVWSAVEEPPTKWRLKFGPAPLDDTSAAHDSQRHITKDQFILQ